MYGHRPKQRQKKIYVDTKTLDHACTGIAFTWNPDPFKTVKWKDRPIFQHRDCRDYLRLLKKCCSDVYIMPELTKHGNIHYHMVLHINDEIKWFKQVLPTFKKTGTIDVNLDIDTGWYHYIEKDKLKMEAILEITLPITRAELERTKYEKKVKGSSLVGGPKSIFDYFL